MKQQLDVMNHSCYDLNDVVTPINVKQLEKFLHEVNYHPDLTTELIEGFHAGFDLGYRGPTERVNTSRNLPFTPGVGDPVDMWNKIMKEVKLNRYAGPYDEVPYKFYVQSPIGLVPKVGGKTRLIFHLSYDFKDFKSINHYTPDDLCKVKYKDLDHAIRTCLRLNGLLPQTQVFTGVAYAKTDVVSAFRILPSKPQQHCLFVLMAYHPVTNQPFYFVDKCLPFGSSRSCTLFQKFSDALTYIMEYKSGFILIMTNYLDDFLIIAYTIALCKQYMTQFLELCQQIGCPTAEDKTEWATQVIIFLGMLLDGRNFRISIPIDKRIKALNSLNWVLDHRKVTIKRVQQLTGILNFLNRVIVPG